MDAGTRYLHDLLQAIVQHQWPDYVIRDEGLIHHRVDGLPLPLTYEEVRAAAQYLFDTAPLRDGPRAWLVFADQQGHEHRFIIDLTEGGSIRLSQAN